MHLTKLVSFAAISLASLLFSGQAFAGVNFVAPGVAGSVTNVTVGANVYNVSFIGNITHNAWVNQLDFSTEAEAQDAVNALAAVINAAGGVTALRFTTPSSTFDHTSGTVWYDSDLTSLYGETLLKSGSNWQLAFPFPGGATAPLNNAFPLALDFTLVPSPWTDIGGGTTGVNGPPTLTMSGPLTTGSQVQLNMVDGAPSAFAMVFFSANSTPVPFLGGTLHAIPFLNNPIIAATDSLGNLSGSVTFSGAPAGTQFWFQVGMVDASVPVHGAALSNAMLGTVP
jgi:hypothetical protein